MASILVCISLNSVFALTEVERVLIEDIRLENAFAVSVVDNVNVNQQIQISTDITNAQIESQDFVYLVQIKDKAGLVISLGWIGGQLTPYQKLSPSLSWTPENDGEYLIEIFVWEELRNQQALSESTKIHVNVR